MQVSDYIYLRQCPNKDGSVTPVAYMLPEYNAEADAATLISSSTSACHGSLVADAIKPMKKKRYIGNDVVYGVN